MSTSECLFCKIVAGDVPATEVARTDKVVAFADIDPKAPTHLLVIPTSHYPDVATLAAAEPEVLAEMAIVAANAAGGSIPDGWRWVFNTGPAAGQVVFHVHGHVLAGREMGWPPG